MSQNANEAWIALLQRIPSDLHDALALGMATGAEIVVQKIVKLEPEFLMIRGRLAGTQDTGRVVFVPYSQLTYIAVQRDMKDAEMDAIFGKAGAQNAIELSPIAKETGAAAAPVVDSPQKPDPNKKALLERLRGQLRDGPAK